MSELIPIIDVFAGPGGLGEGFSAFGLRERKQFFKIGLSVEKDESAHKTLLLRSFFRQFSSGTVPEDYYSFLRGDLPLSDLYDRHSQEYEAAKKEAIRLELGKSRDIDEDLDRRISRIVSGHEKWVLIGGPPCQAYSVIGRSRNVGKEGYKFEDDHRSILYHEYLRILAKHQPPVFVMENVKGLLSAKAHGNSMFTDMISDLHDPASVFSQFKKSTKYKYQIFSLAKHPQKRNGLSGTSLTPEDFVVKCEQYGIPQARHRVILLGIREDFASLLPDILKPESTTYSDAVLFGLPKLRSGLSRESDSHEVWSQKIADIANQSWVKSAEEMYGQDFYDLVINILTSPGNFQHGRGDDQYIPYRPDVIDKLKWWYIDQRVGGVCNHSTRGHIYEDIQRYLFASCFARFKEISPKLHDYPHELLPKHKNAGTGHFEDRFRVQMSGRPSTTITSHISKDGHYYIHPDPRQCRSLTVREAARLQTFPDNYFFCGNRTQQYVQVGNAVPPLLAYKIAEIVHHFLRRV